MSQESLKKYHPYWHVPHSLFEEDYFFDALMSHSDQGLSVWEDQNQVIIEAAIPGLLPEDIEVTFEKGAVWIKGHRKEEEEDRKRNYYRKASRSYSFRVDVPGNIDEAKEPIAEYEHGIMTIRFSKISSQNQPRRIRIKTK